MPYNPYQYRRGNVPQPGGNTVGGATGYTPRPGGELMPPPTSPPGGGIPPPSPSVMGAFPSGYEQPQMPGPKVTQAPSEFMQGLHQTLGSMGEDEKGTFLQAMREKLLQKVYRWQTAIARGLQPDESAMRDFESSKLALADIQRYLTEPEFAEAAADYGKYMQRFPTTQPTPRPNRQRGFGV